MNKRRLFASAMAACMLLSTMTSTALAFGGTENSNDQSQVQTLNNGTGPAANPDTSPDIDAGEIAQPDTTLPKPVEGKIKLTKDVVLSAAVTIDAGVTEIDLNGKTITCTGVKKDESFINIKGSTVTITDNSENRGGKITSGTAGFGIIVSGAELTVTNVSIDGGDVGIYAANAATVTVGEGAVVTTSENAPSNLCGDAIRTYDSTVNVLSGATVEGKYTGTGSNGSVGVDIYGTSDVNIESGAEVIGAFVGVSVYGGEVDIAGKVTAPYAISVYEGPDQDTTKDKTVNVTDSAELIGSTAAIEIAYDSHFNTKADINVTGGMISGDILDAKPANYTGQDFTLNVSGGTFTDAAVFDYLADDADITLGDSIELDEPVSIDGALDLDLNGKTITCTGVKKDESFINIKGSTVNITDNSENKGGKITSATAGFGIIVSGGTLTVTDVTITGGDVGIYAANAATVTVGEGAVVTTSENAPSFGCGDGIRSYDSTVNVLSGGEVEGKYTGTGSNGSVGVDIYGTSDVNIESGAEVIGALVGVNVYGGEVDIAGKVTAPYAISVYEGPNQDTTKDKTVNVTDGAELVGSTAAIELAYDIHFNTKADINVTGGMISGDILDAKPANYTGQDFTLNVSGGYFTSDPSDYVIAEYMAIPSDIDEYKYMVVQGSIDADVKPSVGENDVKTDSLPTNISDEDKSAIATAVGGATATGMDTQASLEASDASKDENLQSDATNALGSIKGEDDTVTIHVQTYLDMKATDYQKYQAPTEGSTEATPFKMTLDITPKFKVIAATTDNAENIKTGDVEGKNAVELTDKGGELDITTTVEVTIPLPANCGVSNGDTLYVTHKGYVYTTTVSDNKVTFTNPHGFSEFTITSEDPSAAKIGETSYASLQDAVNAALASNETATIEIVATGETAPSATVNTPGSFKVQGTATITAGGNVNMTQTTANGITTYTFTTKPTTPSYGGGDYSTPSTPTYAVSVPSKVENGSVSVSAKNPTKGSTVTLTVTPDKGYELDTLTVTDKNGNKITLTDKGNGKFTFTMPASKVDIKATFVETVVAPEAPVNPFYDVAETDYFFDAVLWANENGITSGVGNGEFAPHATCTRAQMVTFLWNAAGCPNVEDTYASFTDVSASDYYYKAVLWAKANGITSGTGEGVFSPDQICNRAQMATFLYKFAEGKAVGSSNRFADVTASDYYAQPVQWAVENGITSGTGADTFGPNDPCTRAQMVTFLYRLLAD